LDGNPAIQVQDISADAPVVVSSTIVSETRFAKLSSNTSTLSSTSTGGRMPLTEESIRSIVAIAEMPLRNLWITQSYADLAHRLLDVLGTNQTWCTFAVWASNTAGLSIRGDELPAFVTGLLLGADPHVDPIIEKANACTALLRRTGLVGELQRSHLERLVAQAVSQVSSFIGNGNTIVYGELAPLFVRVIDYLGTHTAPNPDAVDPTLDELRVPTSDEQPLVRHAFRHYLLAAGATNGCEQAEHVFTANVAAVLHEQQRLQGDIAAALDVGLIDLGADLCGLAHTTLTRELFAPVIHEVRAHIASHLEDLWQHVATRLLMTMSMPGETLHLSRDVPPIPGRTQLFPDQLDQLHNAELIALLVEWDPTKGSGHGSGARDWANIHQRMGYIVNLFRSRQQYVQLTTPPFTSEQLAMMRDGIVPATLIATSECKLLYGTRPHAGIDRFAV
jgi:hypothetical protein